ncbi:acetoacetate--CoA ligase family protein [Pseudonocardia sp. MCCB 268]|nr:acetoacetate--CoA ligase family protein [Pseudonocardia cytotoxica]
MVPGATLNYAEHALTLGPAAPTTTWPSSSSGVHGLERTVTHRELREQVGRARVGLVRRRRPRGTGSSRFAPNSVETPGRVPGHVQPGRDLVVVLAGLRRPCGARPVRPDRAHRAGGCRRLLLQRQGLRHPRERDRPAGADAVAAADGARRYLTRDATLDGTTSWSEFTAEPGPLEFTPGPVRPPAVVLYLRHDRAAEGHRARPRRYRARAPWRDAAAARARAGERVLWFTTTGWMIRGNLWLGGLSSGDDRDVRRQPWPLPT